MHFLNTISQAKPQMFIAPYITYYSFMNVFEIIFIICLSKIDENIALRNFVLMINK